MELTNSSESRQGQLRSPRITPTEQAQIESRPGGGFEASVMCALELSGRDVERMRADLCAGVLESDERCRSLAVAERTARTPTVKSMDLAAELAPISSTPS